MKNILKEAEEIIYGDREQTYGSPSKNLQLIANLWEIYLHGRGLLNVNGAGVSAEDVSLMMVLMKIARLTNTPDHRDSLVDICGYTALIDRINNETKT
jgi:hypothetical protein